MRVHGLDLATRAQLWAEWGCQSTDRNSNTGKGPELTGASAIMRRMAAKVKLLEGGRFSWSPRPLPGEAAWRSRLTWAAGRRYGGFRAKSPQIGRFGTLPARTGSFVRWAFEPVDSYFPPPPGSLAGPSYETAVYRHVPICPRFAKTEVSNDFFCTGKTLGRKHLRHAAGFLFDEGLTVLRSLCTIMKS